MTFNMGYLSPGVIETLKVDFYTYKVYVTCQTIVGGEICYDV